jgi:hypothetical protein
VTELRGGSEGGDPTVALAGGSSGGSSGGTSGSGGGGSLPFTGFAAAGAAAIGSGLLAGGGALMRALRVRRGDR